MNPATINLQDCAYNSHTLDQVELVDYDDLRVEELKKGDCETSNMILLLNLFHANSALSVLAYLVAFSLAVLKWKKAVLKSFPVFFGSLLVSETIQIIARNLYQKSALPIRGPRILTSVVYTGFYINYNSTSIKVFLEETIDGALLWQNILSITLNAYTILRFYKKSSFFIYPIAGVLFLSVQFSTLFVSANDDPSLFSVSAFIPFVPQVCAIISWLICQLLGNHVTNKIHLKLLDHPVIAERHLNLCRVATRITFLNFVEVAPRGCAWIILILTWRVVKNYVPFYATFYEGYLIMFFIETSKYISSLKLLMMYFALKE